LTRLDGFSTIIVLSICWLKCGYSKIRAADLRLALDTVGRVREGQSKTAHAVIKERVRAEVVVYDGLTK
jgi:hypothetical protein